VGEGSPGTVLEDEAVLSENEAPEIPVSNSRSERELLNRYARALEVMRV
jgi:hypothetical protein